MSDQWVEGIDWRRLENGDLQSFCHRCGTWWAKGHACDSARANAYQSAQVLRDALADIKPILERIACALEGAA